MSIGRRLFNLAKSELNSLLDKAAEWDGEAPDESDERSDQAAPRVSGGKKSLEDLTDEELAAEIERRQRERQAGSPSTSSTGPRPRPGAGPSAAPRAGAGPGPQSQRPRSQSAPPPTPAQVLARAYSALEIPQGSSFETVRKAYRTLMRKYHPDRHATSPEKQKAATELAQRLTESYKLLERHLKPR